MTADRPRHHSDAIGSAPADDRTVRGGSRAVLIGQITSQLISLATLALLYRMVPRDQFGLLGMVAPLLLLARVFASLGLNVAAVQRRSLSSGQLSTLFWINLVVSVVAAAVVAIAGPALARLYHVPALSWLSAALAGTLIVAAWGAQHQALLERKLRLGRLAAARVAAQAAGGLAAVIAAWQGLGVGALVTQQYVELALLATLAWQLDSWRPHRPSRGERAGELVVFGGFYSLSSLMFFVAQNADKVLLALWLGSSRQGQVALGMYTQAFNLMMKPVTLVATPVTGVLLPALSRAVHPSEAFTELVVRFFRLVGLVLLPAGAGLLVVAPDLMPWLGGSDWTPAGKMLAALAPVVLVQGWINIVGSVYASSGFARHLSLAATLSAIVLVTGCLAGLLLADRGNANAVQSAQAVALAYTLATLALSAPYLLACLHTVHVSAAAVFRPLGHVLLVTLVMATAVHALRLSLLALEVPLAARLALTVAAGVCLFAALARRHMRWLLQQFLPPMPND